MKTFYSVDYNVLGSDRIKRKWFADLEVAKVFASRDYRDKVVKHTYKDEKKIAEIEYIIANQGEGMYM